MTDWETWGTGAVVKWNDSHWIIVEASSTKVRMICAASNRVTACITDSWPKNPAKRLESIEYVARSVADYIRTQLFNIFPICNERVF